MTVSDDVSPSPKRGIRTMFEWIGIVAARGACMREIGLEVAIVTLLFLYVLHVEKFGTLYHHRGCKSIAAFGRQL